MGRLRARARLICQLTFTALSNGYAKGFLKGRIYDGPSKIICLPGLNCYSCPGALGACPIGSLQAVLGSRKFQFAFYLLGFFMMVGAILGRAVCGWLCPFGLVQDLIHKIPGVKKIKKLPGERILRLLKYLILLFLVILLPLFAVDIVGQGAPWFCQYVCPSGTLMAGVPLVLLNPTLRGAIGFLYAWKLAILIGLLILGVFLWRPFCRYLCPLGAIYAPFNRFALYRFRIHPEKCTQCGACQKACKLDIPVHKTPNSAECVRCGDCRRACPHAAIETTFSFSKKCP